ncbi:hypothetical protein GF1_09470 [Desulfolithobacter dissulfuricans]|uniref:Cytochrome c7-like domain-containing protein n=1 Tax=Desulfolithobacter dissulfuricans TaxID=2795293 RepID=A0A915U928_9BACT|nr:c(7)-type cytochrome triheme domain-containing protein [Desulfolithobacter dissulfuricans]BCO08571.1 hypothetical protein GF1_09470 [Desulfolithobacter dissulfuricans]
MKLQKKILYTFAVAACTGLIYAAGSQASSEAESQTADSYGPTVIVSKKPVKMMFSHKYHAISLGLDCNTCHPDIFEKKKGWAESQEDYNMEGLDEGKYCGTCHNGDDAFATNDEASCTQCHGEMNPPKTIIFDKPVKAVVFDHQMHVDMDLGCSSCHNKVFKMQLGAAEEHPEKFVMQALYEGKYCGACHNGDDAFASDTKCTTCHIGVIGFERLMSGGKGEKKEHGGGH